MTEEGSFFNLFCSDLMKWVNKWMAIRLLSWGNFTREVHITVMQCYTWKIHRDKATKLFLNPWNASPPRRLHKAASHTGVRNPYRKRSQAFQTGPCSYPFRIHTVCGLSATERRSNFFFMSASVGKPIWNACRRLQYGYETQCEIL